MRNLKWFVIAAFIAVEVVLVLLQQTGPFTDDGIYVVAGRRTLEGFGMSDQYLTWFAGSLLWPAIAGAAFKIAGLVGLRLAALAFVAAAYIFVVDASETLFGEKVGTWTALAFGVNGELLSVARLGVYDIPAILGIAVAFWATTKLIMSNHRKWVLVIAISLMFAFLGKYPSIIMIAPIAALIINKRGWERARLDLGIIGFILAALFLAFVLPAFDQISRVLTFVHPDFGQTRLTIAYNAVNFTALPLILAALGAWLFARNQMSAILIGSLFIWPAYHIITGNPAGDQKHVVLGFIFAYPVVGLFLSRLAGENWTSFVKASTIAMVAFYVGAVQMDRLDHWWPEVRPVAQFLQLNVKPGEKILDNDSWQHMIYLYPGNMNSPWDAFDTYRVTHEDKVPPICEFKWFVNEEGSQPWSDEIVSQVKKCGFQKVFEYQSPTVWGVGGHLQYATYTVRTTIWKRP